MIESGLVSPGLSFVAGVLTVGSPCVLPLLPMVLGAGAAGGPGARPVFIAAGFALSFTLLALTVGALQRLLGLDPQRVRDVAAVLMVVFGLSMVWPGAFQRVSAALGGLLGRAASLGDRAGSGWAGGLLVGCTLGAVWTPCAGPVLASILTLVSAQSHWAAASSLLGLFALGAAIPMLAVAYGGRWAASKARSLAAHTHRLQRGLGVIVAAVGLLTFLQQDTLLTLWLSDFYPSFSTGL